MLCLYDYVTDLNKRVLTQHIYASQSQRQHVSAEGDCSRMMVQHKKRVTVWHLYIHGPQSTMIADLADSRVEHCSLMYDGSSANNRRTYRHDGFESSTLYNRRLVYCI